MSNSNRNKTKRPKDKTNTKGMKQTEAEKKNASEEVNRPKTGGQFFAEIVAYVVMVLIATLVQQLGANYLNFTSQSGKIALWAGSIVILLVIWDKLKGNLPVYKNHKDTKSDSKKKK